MRALLSFLIGLHVFAAPPQERLPARSPGYLNWCAQRLSQNKLQQIKVPSDIEWVLDAKQLDPVIKVLNEAFAEDRLLAWMNPIEINRQKLIQTFVYHAFFNGGVLQSRLPGVGAALWFELNKVQTDLISLIATGQLFLFPSFGLHGLELLKFDNHAAKIRNNIAKGQEALYLFFVGVAKSHQGRGHGSKLIKTILEYADTTDRLVILETQKEQNVLTYKHLGFEIAAESVVPDGIPLSYTMVRKPKK
jgi:GNAT superfamily N-acetyltransferase